MEIMGVLRPRETTHKSDFTDEKRRNHLGLAPLSDGAMECEQKVGHPEVATPWTSHMVFRILPLQYYGPTDCCDVSGFWAGLNRPRRIEAESMEAGNLDWSAQKDQQNPSMGLNVGNEITQMSDLQGENRGNPNGLTRRVWIQLELLVNYREMVGVDPMEDGVSGKPG